MTIPELLTLPLMALVAPPDHDLGPAALGALFAAVLLLAGLVEGGGLL